MRDEQTEDVADDLRQRLDEARDRADAASLTPIVEALRSEDDASRLADRTATIIGPDWSTAVEVLLQLDVTARLKKVYPRGEPRFALLSLRTPPGEPRFALLSLRTPGANLGSPC